MEYKDYLETEHWKNFRKKVYKSKRGKKCRGGKDYRKFIINNKPSNIT